MDEEPSKKPEQKSKYVRTVEARMRAAQLTLSTIRPSGLFEQVAGDSDLDWCNARIERKAQRFVFITDYGTLKRAMAFRRAAACMKAAGTIAGIAYLVYYVYFR